MLAATTAPVVRNRTTAVHESPMRFYGPSKTNGYQLFHSHELPFPEFPAFTHVNEAVCTSEHVLGEHRHPHLEICYVHAGRARWTCDGIEHPLTPGDCFVARPGEVHSGKPDPRDPNHNFAVGFDPVALTGGRIAAIGNDLDQAVIEQRSVVDLPGGQRVIPGGHGAERIYRQLLDECDRAPAEGPGRALALIMVQALLVELFVHVTRLALAHADLTAAPGTHPAVTAVIDWLPQCLAEPPDLATMAARAGLSPSHFAAVFRAATGRTPLEHLTRLRCEAAARRLVAEPQRGVTDIALDLGFCSSQYFSVVFRRNLGCTPGEWRKRN